MKETISQMLKAEAQAQQIVSAAEQEAAEIAAAPEPEPEPAPEPPKPAAKKSAPKEALPAEAAAAEAPADEWTEEDTAAAANVGTLRAWLHAHGSELSPLTQAECKALAGYGEVEWKDLREEDRIAVIAAAKAKIAEGK